MLSLILAASISQIYAKDFAFIKAQEDWVIDTQPQGTGYQWYVPKHVLDRIERWLDPCPQQQKQAVDELVSMGPDVIRPMFWASRARNQDVAYLSERVLDRLRLCTICKGTGKCPGFKNEEGVSTSACKFCYGLQYLHEDEHSVRECRTCDGRGYDMKIPGDYTP